MELANFVKDGVDLAIRYGAGCYSDVAVERLLTESVVPVCSPEFLERHGPFEGPADLVEATLLHDDSPDNDPSCPNWEMWLTAAGARHVDAARGRVSTNRASSSKPPFSGAAWHWPRRHWPRAICARAASCSPSPPQ